MKKFRVLLLGLLLALTSSVLTSCSSEEEEVLLDHYTVSQYRTGLIGKWQEKGTQIYWQFFKTGAATRVDHSTGNYRDAADDVTEDEATLLEWFLEEEGLYICYWMEIDQNYEIPELPFTILYMDETTMKWKDGSATVELIKLN